MASVSAKTFKKIWTQTLNADLCQLKCIYLASGQFESIASIARSFKVYFIIFSNQGWTWLILKPFQQPDWFFLSPTSLKFTYRSIITHGYRVISEYNFIQTRRVRAFAKFAFYLCLLLLRIYFN